uniref:Immunoglobulin domain-containing protein n=1 Tax=Sinocyclocheilus anshuiensis TaxID=1608454 RepID=A0A671MKV3_9TELE
MTKSVSVCFAVVSADAVKPVSVLVGDSVTLLTGLTYIHDVIQWRSDHQNSPVAEIDRKAGLFNTSDGRFTDKLQLDCLTGSLTIRNIGTRHSGLYKADISSSKHTIHKTFNVTVRDAVKSELVTKGETVTLQTNVTEIQKDDQILWIFGEIVIAEINKAAQRFNKGRLKLNNQTGSLNITNTKTTDSGLYELKISSSRHIILRRITVTVTGE